MRSARSCSSAASRSARTLMRPRWNRLMPGSVTFFVRSHSSSSACDLRSSGARPRPAAIALSGRPGGSATPSITTSPASRRSTPQTARSSSLRPAPTRPPIPSTSPRRRSKLASFTSGRRRNPRTSQQHVVGAAAAVGEELLELAADHQRHQLVGARRRGQPRSDRHAAVEHGDPIADLADLVEPVRDVDDTDAFGGEPPHDARRGSRPRCRRGSPTARP